MRRLFVNKGLLALFLVCLSISSLTVFELVQVLAIPADSRNSTVEPGSMSTPCNYHNYQDSGKFIGRNCKTGANDFKESSAYQLLQDEMTSNIARYWEPGVWDFTASGGAGANLINVHNTTDWGVYGQTFLKCGVNGCVAWNIGDQNTNDKLFHASNMTLHDLVFTGPPFSLCSFPSCLVGCLGITTANNIYVNHVILQNCSDLGTGCLRVTNWNANQIQSKNIFIENTLFLQCKIGLTGTIGGYLRNSIFNGTGPNIDATRGLVDFSKADIAPTKVNNLGNFCFCGNTIIGWTRQVFIGFQAVSNDTIADNVMIGANGFITTTDTTNGIYFEGLTVRNNYYSSSTGGAHFGFGHSIIFRDNVISFDTNANLLSTAISFSESLNPQVNQIPKNVQIVGNEVYQWGGIGIDAGFRDGVISDNQIYNVNQGNTNQNSAAGLYLNGNLSDVVVSSNSIISDTASGAGASRPISYNGATNVTVTGNYLRYQACGVNVVCGVAILAAMKKTAVFMNNFGFNPYGVITNPFSNTAVTVGLSGAVAVPIQGNTYKVIGLDLWITSTGGSISVTVVDAQSLQIATGLTTLTNYHLGWGYSITFNTFSAATEVVVGG